MDRTVLSIVAGLGGMFGWGTSDFLASGTSEAVGHTRAFFWSQVAGLVLIALLLLVLAPNFSLTPFLICLTILSGLSYAFGYLFFYKGFEIGNVSVISAVVNLQVIFVIVISLFPGQSLTLLQVPAISILLLGIVLVSVNFNKLKKGSISLLGGVKETLIATILFGVLYWPLNEFIVEEADWLAVSFVTKLAAILFILFMTTFKKRPLAIHKATKKLAITIVAIGLLEAIAVLSVSYGQSYGDGIIVAPISSALTVVTVGLAVIFLKERISLVQGIGIAMVISGIILTAF